MCIRDRATRLCKLVEEANLTEAGNLFELETGEKVDMSEVRVTVSVGVATCDESCKNIDVLMDHALSLIHISEPTRPY